MTKSPEVLNADEKRKLLEAIQEEVKVCTNCSLGTNRNPKDKGCLYIGNTNAKVMLIGKAPGWNEAKTGYLFSGRAGNELKWFLTNSGIDFKDVYITNVCHCRTSETSSTLKTKEIKGCAPWLRAQLKILRPKIVLMMGSPAVYAVMGKKFTMNEVRGRVIDFEGMKLIASFHPAYYTRSTVEVEDRNKDEGLEDWRLLKKTMEELKCVS